MMLHRPTRPQPTSLHSVPSLSFFLLDQSPKLSRCLLARPFALSCLASLCPRLTPPGKAYQKQGGAHQPCRRQAQGRLVAAPAPAPASAPMTPLAHRPATDQPLAAIISTPLTTGPTALLAQSMWRIVPVQATAQATMTVPMETRAAFPVAPFYHAAARLSSSPHAHDTASVVRACKPGVVPRAPS